jgi:heme/copper-type cytochrome/quinol oxidase subunit 2
MTILHRLAFLRGFALTVLLYWSGSINADVPPGWLPAGNQPISGFFGTKAFSISIFCIVVTIVASIWLRRKRK